MTAPTTTTTPIIVVKDEESFRRAVGVVSFVLGLGNVVATKRLSVEDYIYYTYEIMHKSLLHSDSSESLMFTLT